MKEFTNFKITLRICFCQKNPTPISFRLRKKKTQTPTSFRIQALL